MRTQSLDTSPEAERILVALIQAAPSQKRFHLLRNLSLGYSPTNNRIHLSEREALISYCARSYGSRLATCVQEALDQQENWHLQPSDLMAAMWPAVQTLEHFGMRSYIGGSIASSMHGMQQTAQDIDLVVSLPNLIAFPLVEALKKQYVMDESAVAQALQQRKSFVLIHLDTLQKIDIIVPPARPFDQAMGQLVTEHILAEHSPPFRVASASEMIVWKLRRYHRFALTDSRGREDDATWNDVLGMLKVQAPSLDLPLLEKWARAFHLSALLTRALVDAGCLPGTEEESQEWKQARERLSLLFRE